MGIAGFAETWIDGTARFLQTKNSSKINILDHAEDLNHMQRYMDYYWIEKASIDPPYS